MFLIVKIFMCSLHLLVALLRLYFERVLYIDCQYSLYVCSEPLRHLPPLQIKQKHHLLLYHQASLQTILRPRHLTLDMVFVRIEKIPAIEKLILYYTYYTDIIHIIEKQKKMYLKQSLFHTINIEFKIIK